MVTNRPLPGTPQQQQLLRTIAGLYTDDARVLAVLVFGSLGRGTWDAYSDLDLAVIVRDDVQIDMHAEIARMRAAFTGLGEQIAFTEVAGQDGFIALQSLIEVALEYRLLRAISPYVHQGFVVLTGAIDPATIRSAADANREPLPPLSQRLHQTLWLAMIVDVYLQRGGVWAALPTLERMRTNLLDIFADSRNRIRPYRLFDELAGPVLKAKFSRCLPACAADSLPLRADALSAALFGVLDLVEQDLQELSNGQLQLTADEREFLARIRARQAACHEQ